MESTLAGLLIAAVAFAVGWVIGVGEQAKSTVKHCEVAGQFLMADRVFICHRKEGK